MDCDDLPPDTFQARSRTTCRALTLSRPPSRQIDLFRNVLKLHRRVLPEVVRTTPPFPLLPHPSALYPCRVGAPGLLKDHGQDNGRRADDGGSRPGRCRRKCARWGTSTRRPSSSPTRLLRSARSAPRLSVLSLPETLNPNPEPLNRKP